MESICSSNTDMYSCVFGFRHLEFPHENKGGHLRGELLHQIRDLVGYDVVVSIIKTLKRLLVSQVRFLKMIDDQVSSRKFTCLIEVSMDKRFERRGFFIPDSFAIITTFKNRNSLNILSSFLFPCKQIVV